ncbi:hypothetical protein N0V94_001692 [Neodidymelliopsis sp. IMI 364377]|nr:hypothetical protein N0V94_001692 [Neodidymelliopsis sp. IMI 364377]
MGAAQDRLIEDAELELQPKEVDALRRGLCGACGNPMIAGWSCKVAHQIQSKRVRKEKKPGKESTQPVKTVVYTCLRCERETVQLLQSRPAKHVKKSTSQKITKVAPEIPKPTEEDDSKVSKSVNASSKQRKKARKGGLQAMLEKSKSQSSNQGGFDLMDFGM